MESAPIRKRRRRWPWVILAILFAFLAFAGPHWWGRLFLFRKGALVGLTAQQVIDHCGVPYFAAGCDEIADTENPGWPIPPHWQTMSAENRKQLVAMREFTFGYYYWLGDLYSVRFENGRVTDVQRGSK